MTRRAAVLPPIPPELHQPPGGIRAWADTLLRWIEFLLQALRDQLQGTEDLRGTLTTLEARVKDVYTFQAQGSLVIGLVGLPLRVVENATIIEAHAAVETAPTVSDLQIAVLLNGASQGLVVIAPGQQTGLAPLAVALTKDTDRLQPQITQVGSGEPGRDLVVQMRAR